MSVTSVTATETPLECVVTVDGGPVAQFGGFESPADLEAFTRSLVAMAVGVQGRRILSSEAALDHAREPGYEPRRRRNTPPNTNPVADLRGLDAVNEPADGVLWQWTRTDP